VSNKDTRAKGGLKVNKALLKSVMVLNGHTIKDLALLLNIAQSSVSSKINENGSEFKQGEIATIAKEYNLTPEQIAAIFFN
jgi:hypothetical protein